MKPSQINIKHTSLGQTVCFQSRADVEKRQAEVLAAINALKSQLHESADALSGSAEDRDRYLSAELALRARQIEHQELSRILGSLTAGQTVARNTYTDWSEYVRSNESAGIESGFPMDVPACEALESHLLRDMASIKAQIARSVSKARSSGKYADRHWFTNANTALRIKQATHQALQLHTAGLRRDHKQKQASAFPNFFFEAARRLLPKQLYMDLLTEAERLQTEAESKDASQ
jgi:hypothetical protein